ncbi:MAG: helix-turn-helix domain-containing protein [Geminicoccaceae bacterium]
MADRPHEIDIHVGQRLKLRRTLMGMSQERLGELLGLTFQQVQKYERGANRIGASRLYEIGQILEVPVNYFFEQVHVIDGYGGPGVAEDGVSFDFGPERTNGQVDLPPGGTDRRDTLELIRAFDRVRHPELRRRVLDLAKALAAFEDDRGAHMG